MAYRGIDLRDLYRRGSGLTPRRLLHLVRWLPWDDPVQVLLRLDAEQIKKPAPDEIRSRAAQWRADNERRAREAANG